MERSEILAAMGELKLFGMRSAFDGIVAAAVKRQHEPQRVIGDLVSAEIAEKQARSIKYQMTTAKLPLAKDVDDFRFEGTPVNEALVRDLAGGDFLAQQRNAVLVGGTGTGKTHLAIGIARALIRGGARGRFYTRPHRGCVSPPPDGVQRLRKPHAFDRHRRSPREGKTDDTATRGLVLRICYEIA